eukprot:15261873-Alexandrium_andersonii.AAC.1
MVFSKASIVALIENSRVFKVMFAQYVRATPDGIGAKIANLRLAKQRFESTQKPLGRFGLWIYAV